MSQKTITYLSIIIIVIGSIFLANGLILAWTAPGSAPSAGNVSTPLNVGSTAQTKSGSLRSDVDMRATVFYDQDNTGYYVNPAGASIFNDLKTYDDIYVGSSSGDDTADMYIADKIYDWDNTGYYINPAGVSRLNDIRPNIMYDGQNTSYYVDPASNSWLYRLYSRDIRADIMYDRNNTGYYINPAGTSRTGRINANNLYSYSWVYGTIFYDRNNTSYYVDPAGTSVLNGLTVGSLYQTGNHIINNTSPTIYFQDTNHRSAMVHVNSNLFYVLRGCGVNSASWCATGGRWPLVINLENNNAEFGGNVWAVSYSGPGCDIAELYEPSQDSEELEPGDIVVLDEEEEKKIKKSSHSYSALVVGVVSTNPNMTMGVLEDNENHPPVALLGRVPTKVTAENGPIKIGDLIVSSSKPGYGMRCDNYDKCQGAVVGKATENLESGEGMIEVLIKGGF